MSVRTTSTDPVGFIYDSVSGLAIGECWSEDESELMDSFVEWYQKTYAEDMRSNPSLPAIRNEFMEMTEIERKRFSSTYGKA